MKYVIMSGDTEVANVTDGKVTITNEQLAPLLLKRTCNFEEWLASRVIDKSRPNSRTLKKAHGLSRLSGSTDTALKYNAATVTDNFWVKDSNSKEQWADVKPKNDFYFHMALDSDGKALESKPQPSPELTNIGSREKGWKLEDGNWWLYKNTREMEQKAELITYKLGTALGFSMAYYEINDGYIRTKDFTQGSVNLQHALGMVFDHKDGDKEIVDDDLTYNYKTLKAINEEIASDFVNMQYLDALVANPDRHTENYGFLTDQNNGNILSLAPNYDNDMALYNYPNLSDAQLQWFSDFIKENDIAYEPPALTEGAMLAACLGDEEIADILFKRKDKLDKLL